MNHLAEPTWVTTGSMLSNLTLYSLLRLLLPSLFLTLFPLLWVFVRVGWNLLLLLIGTSHESKSDV